MSQQRVNHATQNDWSRWLYEQGRVDGNKTGSFVGLGLGFTDLDTVGYCHNNGNLILIETKQGSAPLRPSQQLILEAMYLALTQSLHEQFKGVHLLQFENTAPDNGATVIRSYDGEKWKLVKDDFTSSAQIQNWFLAQML